MRDVITSHATGVEGTHRQLGTGFTNGLSGDDADGFTHVHQLAGGQRTAVATCTDTDFGFTGQHRASTDLGHALGNQLGQQRCGKVNAGLGQRGPLDLDIFGQPATDD